LAQLVAPERVGRREEHLALEGQALGRADPGLRSQSVQSLSPGVKTAGASSVSNVALASV
jgi:hypothetical protein